MKRYTEADADPWYLGGALTAAHQDVRTQITRSIKEKGWPNWSPHTTLGVMVEEYDEFKDAIRANDPQQILAELEDIAGAAILGIACIKSDLAKSGRVKTDAQR